MGMHPAIHHGLITDGCTRVISANHLTESSCNLTHHICIYSPLISERCSSNAPHLHDMALWMLKTIHHVRWSMICLFFCTSTGHHWTFWLLKRASGHNSFHFTTSILCWCDRILSTLLQWILQQKLQVECLNVVKALKCLNLNHNISPILQLCWSGFKAPCAASHHANPSKKYCDHSSHWWAFIIPASHVNFWHYDHSACLYEPDWGDNLFFTTRSVNNQLQSNKWATKCIFQVATAKSKEATWFQQSTLLWIMPEKWENRYMEASITEQLWWWPFISVVEGTVKQWSLSVLTHRCKECFSYLKLQKGQLVMLSFSFCIHKSI